MRAAITKQRLRVGSMLSCVSLICLLAGCQNIYTARPTIFTFMLDGHLYGRPAFSVTRKYRQPASDYDVRTYLWQHGATAPPLLRRRDVRNHQPVAASMVSSQTVMSEPVNRYPDAADGPSLGLFPQAEPLPLPSGEPDEMLELAPPPVNIEVPAELQPPFSSPLQTPLPPAPVPRKLPTDPADSPPADVSDTDENPSSNPSPPKSRLQLDGPTADGPRPIQRAARDNPIQRTGWVVPAARLPSSATLFARP